ncbi:heat shock cognate protein [Trifolium repens]|nr:heat shock cognate protein [Trifolium repens]
MQVLLWYVFGEYAFAFVSSAGNRIHRMLKLGLSIDEDATENDADMPPLEEADADAEGSKMEEMQFSGPVYLLFTYRKFWCVNCRLSLVYGGWIDLCKVHSLAEDDGVTFCVPKATYNYIMYVFVLLRLLPGILT